MKSSGRLPDSLRSPHTDMNAHGRLCVFKRQNRARDSFLATAMERMLINQLLIVPIIYYPLYFVVSSYVQQLGPRQGLKRAKKEFWQLLTKSCNNIGATWQMFADVRMSTNCLPKVR